MKGAAIWIRVYRFGATARFVAAGVSGALSGAIAILPDARNDHRRGDGARARV